MDFAIFFANNGTLEGVCFNRYSSILTGSICDRQVSVVLEGASEHGRTKCVRQG
jgi:hypothetical protein